MKILPRALIILTLIFLIRLSFSCCRCPEQVAEYQFDQILIANLDNSGWNANPTEYNKMYAATVAFKVNLLDTSFRPPMEMAQTWRPKLSSAMAMERCECPYHLFLKSEISRFSVLTLRDFSPDKPAGSDIVGSFVWQTGWNHLYLSIGSLLAELNEPYYGFLSEKSIQFYCQDSVQNDSLQLVFQFHFTNGEILSDTTNLIAIQISGGEEVL